MCVLQGRPWAIFEGDWRGTTTLPFVPDHEPWGSNYPNGGHLPAAIDTIPEEYRNPTYSTFRYFGLSGRMTTCFLLESVTSCAPAETRSPSCSGTAEPEFRPWPLMPTNGKWCRITYIIGGVFEISDIMALLATSDSNNGNCWGPYNLGLNKDGLPFCFQLMHKPHPYSFWWQWDPAEYPWPDSWDQKEQLIE